MWLKRNIGVRLASLLWQEDSVCGRRLNLSVPSFLQRAVERIKKQIREKGSSH